MAKVNLTIELNDKEIIGSVKAEVRKEIINLIKNDLNNEVKGRKVVIEGLIESAIREEIKQLIKTDKEIKYSILNQLKNISYSETQELIKSVLGEDFKSIVRSIAEDKVRKLSNLIK